MHETLAHLVSTSHTSPVGFVTGLVAARFSFDRALRAGIDRHLGASPEHTLASYRAIQHVRTTPPGPKTTWLGEAIVHAEDIRRPLGIAHTYDPGAVRQVADFYAGSNLIIGAKSRIAGLRLVATDQDWTHGEGAEVAGPALSLLLAMSGRAVACDELTGPGVETLRSRQP